MDAPAPAEQDKLAASALPETRKAALLEITKRAYDASVRGEYARAEALCLLIYRVAALDHNVSVVARAKTIQAIVFREYGEYREALAAIDESLAYFEQHPDDRGIVAAYQSKGIIYNCEGDFARALVNYNRALSLAKDTELPGRNYSGAQRHRGSLSRTGPPGARP